MFLRNGLVYNVNQSPSPSVVPLVNPAVMAPAASKTANLPQFNARNINFWFVQVEAAFRSASITNDQVMFDHVITSMDATHASEVSDIIESPPEEDKYKALKKTLIERLAETEQARIKRTLTSEQLGDRSPSAHLRHLKQAAGKDFSETVLQSIWMEALPLDVRMIVAGCPTMDLDGMARVADQILLHSGTRSSRNPSVAAVTGDQSPSANQSPDSLPASVSDVLANLTKQISSLEKTLKQSVRTSATRSRSKSPGRERIPTKSRKTSNQSPESDGLCWYHRVYGDKAKKCRDPCTWSQQHQGNDNRQ